jgi:hypothetical protein
LSNPEYLHHLVAEVIDNLHGDATGLGLRERTRRVAVQRGPRFLVDLGLERCLEGAVGIAGAEEIGAPDEETLLIIVRVDEPAAIPSGPSLRTSPVFG